MKIWGKNYELQINKSKVDKMYIGSLFEGEGVMFVSMSNIISSLKQYKLHTNFKIACLKNLFKEK